MNMMTNTGTNFFSRFGDRLPTRESKSRKGRINYITSQGGMRGRSMADTGQPKNFTEDNEKAKQD
jgi:hypothetical protein